MSECVARNQAAVSQFLSRNPGFAETIEAIGEECWRDHAPSLPLPVSNCR